MNKIWNDVLNMLLSVATEGMRNSICNKYHITQGKNARIGKNVFFEDYRNVEIGVNGHVNKYVRFYTGRDHGASVVIGNNVLVGMECIFITTTHEIGPSKRRGGSDIQKDIRVGDGAWLGARCTILPGVHIGEGCIIHAGSVVSKDCRPNCIYGGNPAKMVTDLSKIKALS